MTGITSAKSVKTSIFQQYEYANLWSKFPHETPKFHPFIYTCGCEPLIYTFKTSLIRTDVTFVAESLIGLYRPNFITLAVSFKLVIFALERTFINTAIQCVV